MLTKREGRKWITKRWEDAGCPPIEIDESEAGPLPLMSAADLILTTDGPVLIQATAATRAAHAARNLSGS